MVTIKDIAKQAGVTPSTVSRVLNQSGGYSDKTRQKVLQIAAELHYQKNEAASNLVAQTSNVIGVLITNATTSFAAPIIDGIEDWAYQHGIRILLAHCGLNDAARLKACLDLMAGQKVSGILSISVQFDATNLALLKQLGLPLVSLGVKVDGYPTVAIDDEKAAYTGTKYLLNRGYRRIALAAIDPTDPQTGRARCHGYQRALQKTGLAPLIIPGDYSFQAGYQAAKQLWQAALPPEAIFAASDDAAAGIVFYAQSQGLAVPEQLAVLGFDNSYVADLVYPGLTTVEQPFAQMGQLAIEALVMKTPLPDQVAYQIKERHSVGWR